MSRLRWSVLALAGALLAASSPARADETDRSEDAGFTWAGEIRFHGGAINSDEGFGRTGSTLQTRFFLDYRLPIRLRFFAEAGSGNAEGSDDAGIERLYAEYAFPGEADVRVTAGWIRLPYGRWDALTLSRPLIKDRQYFTDSPSVFQLRRTSAGVGVHASGGPFEMDLAYVDRQSSNELSMPDSPDRDAVGRIGLRHAGFSAGVSYLRGFGRDPVDTALGPVDIADVISYGVDLELSRGRFTFGGEAVTLDIGGRTSNGYYVQGAYDLSAFARGLRLIGKYDVLRESGDPTPLSFQRYTLGARYSLRRDLDLDLEFDRDAGDRARGFGGSHVIAGLRYRF